MAFKGQKKGMESADGTNVPNSFNDFHFMYDVELFIRI